MIRIKILKNMSESLEKKKKEKKRNPVSGPSGREHPHNIYIYKFLSKAYFKRNRIDLKQQMDTGN